MVQSSTVMMSWILQEPLQHAPLRLDRVWLGRELQRKRTSAAALPVLLNETQCVSMGTLPEALQAVTHVHQDVDSDALDEVSKRRRPKKRSASVDSEDLDVATPSTNAPGPTTPVVERKVKPGPLKAVGQFMTCGECAKKFTVVRPSLFGGRGDHDLTPNQTAYTKEHPKISSTYLCVPCCYVLGINPFEKAKKPSKKATGGKDDRAKIVHYEERKGAAGLSDLCIQVSHHCISM
jgi:hypothetical protein